jgi:phosphatidylglycerophosphatase A
MPTNFDTRSWRHWLAFGLGSGLSPKAPGTMGSALALLFYILLSHLPPMVYAGVVITAFAFGIWLCEETAKDLGVHDHGGIVWDEFVGMWLTLFLAPPQWFWLLIGFVLFRLLDILKPWPIKWADKRVEGGLGIMLDDVLAGIMAALCLQALTILLV